MARDFAPTNNDNCTFLYRSAATAPAQGTALTVCAWINPDTIAGADMIVGRDESAAGDRVYQFRINGGKVECIVFIGGSAKTAAGASTASTGVWSFAAGRLDGTNVTCYLNSGTADGTAAASGNLDADPVGISIGVRSTQNDGSGAAEAFDGKIGEVAEWTRALTDAELLFLSKGYSPRFIPLGLNWYVPLIGRTDPEIELRRGAGMTVTVLGTGGDGAAVSPHPRIIYPRRKLITGVASAAGGTTVSPGKADLTLTGNAPTVTRTTNHWVIPAVGALTITGFAPTVTVAGQGVTVAPDKADLAITGNAPTVSVTTNHWTAPGKADLALTGQAPTVAVTTNNWVQPNKADLALTTYAPTVLVGVVAQPSAAALEITGHAPTVSVTANHLVNPGTAAIQVTGFAPTVIGGELLQEQRGGTSKKKKKRAKDRPPYIWEQAYQPTRPEVLPVPEAAKAQQAAEVTQIVEPQPVLAGVLQAADAARSERQRKYRRALKVALIAARMMDDE